MSVFLSVIVPTYNQEKNIVKTLTAVFGYLSEQAYSNEIIVVDDGSLDQTVPLIRAWVQDKANILLICSTHKGKASAVLQGLRASQGDFVLFTDADLATPIEEVRRLLVWLTDHDFQIAIASREGLGAQRENEPIYRHWMGRVFNLIIKLVLGLPYEDTQCGFKVFSRRSLKAILPALRLYSDKAHQIKEARVTAFDAEILFLAKLLELPVKEVPVPWKYGKSSKVHWWRDSWRMLLEVVSVRLWFWLGRYRLYEKTA